MNTSYLKSFYYVAKFNSISQASKKLYISQPGLSMQLKKLESELGYNLLTRSNQGVLLTSIGEVVFDYAKSLFKLEDELYEEINNLNMKRDKLSIAACKNFGSFYFASKIHQFKEIYENSNVTIDTYNSSIVLDKIQNSEYNIGIILGTIDPKIIKNIELTKFFSDELVLCGNFNYPKEFISIKDLFSSSFVMREENSGTYSLVKNYLENMNIKIDNLNILFTCNCNNIIKHALMKGSGFSFLPKSSIEYELKYKLLKIIEIEDLGFSSSLLFNYSFVKRKHYDLNSYEKKFRNFLSSI